LYKERGIGTSHARRHEPGGVLSRKKISEKFEKPVDIVRRYEYNTKCQGTRAAGGASRRARRYIMDKYEIVDRIQDLMGEADKYEIHDHVDYTEDTEDYYDRLCSAAYAAGSGIIKYTDDSVVAYYSPDARPIFEQIGYLQRLFESTEDDR
jgi:hypothetical protein